MARNSLLVKAHGSTLIISIRPYLHSLCGTAPSRVSSVRLTEREVEKDPWVHRKVFLLCYKSIS